MKILNYFGNLFYFRRAMMASTAINLHEMPTTTTKLTDQDEVAQLLDRVSHQTLKVSEKVMAGREMLNAH